MTMEKINKIIKKHNKEIVERVKKVVGVTYDEELISKSDFTRGDLNSFKTRDNRAFYKKLVYFCVERNVNVIWLINGAGDMFIQTPQDAANTPEERDLIRKLLAVLRHSPDEAMKAVFGNLLETYDTAYFKVAGDSTGKPDLKGGDPPM